MAGHLERFQGFFYGEKSCKVPLVCRVNHGDISAPRFMHRLEFYFRRGEEEGGLKLCNDHE